MRPREMYCETTFTPRSPVMQDSFTTSTGFLSFETISLPAKLSVGSARMLAVRMQNLAMLCLVIVVLGLCLVWFLGCQGNGTARLSSLPATCRRFSELR